VLKPRPLGTQLSNLLPQTTGQSGIHCTRYYILILALVKQKTGCDHKAAAAVS